MRICTKCNTKKESDAFYRRLGKLRKTCKECDKQYLQEWRLQNKKKAAAYDKKYYDESDWRKVRQKINHVRALSDCYIKSILKQSGKPLNKKAVQQTRLRIKEKRLRKLAHLIPSEVV